MTSASSPSPVQVPLYTGDLASPDALRFPDDHYRAIRDLGPIVRLEHPSMFAMARFREVRQALKSADVLISSQGVGFNDIVNGPRDPDSGSVLEADGARHARMRQMIAAPLMPNALNEHRQVLKSMIETRIRDLTDTGEFDAVPAIAQFLPLEVIVHLVGLPKSGEAKMLDWAAAVFNVMGPIRPGEESSPRFASDLQSFGELTSYLATLRPEDMRENSWTDMLFKAAQEGRFSLEEAHGSVSAYVVPSLDTTILAKASFLHTLGTHPDQWEKLRNDHSLIRSAVRESVRYSPSVRWFSRVASSDYRDGEVTLRAGDRVMLMYGAANRDERHYPDADRFDVTRNPTDQLGWGYGAHVCVGQHLARIEMEVMLEALLENVKTIEVGTPVMSLNKTLYGVTSLPVQLHSA